MPGTGGSTRVLGRATTVVAFVLLVAAVVGLGGGYLLGYRTYVVRSGSMGDAAPVGSVAIVRPVPAAEVAVGDVIIMEPTGRPGAMPVLHRVIERSGPADVPSVQTKGDANANPDPQAYLVHDSALVMAAAVPRIGYVVGLVRTRLGWWTLIVLPSALLGLIWLRELWTFGEPKQPARA